MILNIREKRITVFSAIFLLSQSFLAFYNLPTKSEEKKFVQNNAKTLIEERNRNKEKELSQLNLDRDYYLIGPGDILKVTLFDAPEFSGEVSVLSDGNAQFPLIGMQYLSDLTIEQAKNLIFEKYRKELLRPELNLEIHIPRPIRVSLIGEIEKPGIYSLTTNNYSSLAGASKIENNGLPTIIDAIQKAGGITQEANLKEVSLIRRLPGSNKEHKKANINLLEVVLEGDQSQNLFLFDGDTIKLNKAKEIPKDLKNISQTNISPQVITINVVGQVKSSGKMEVKANTPLIQAIYMAGGPIDWKSNKGSVELLRIKRNGSASRRKFKIKLDQDISPELNPPLMNGDIVYVRSNTINRISTGLGAITEPIAPIVTSLTFFKILTE